MRDSPTIDHEQLVLQRGARSGVPVIVAVHSTRLGPALGGARMWHFADPLDGVADALRLAGAMTLKAAAAGLDLGGGKGVICAPPEPGPNEREAMLLDFADLVDSLEGAYITAEDVGTSASDMAVVAQRTEHVVGLPAKLGGSGDPSPVTAAGVEAAIRASCAAGLGSRELAGVRVTVIGLGHVGGALARRLAAAGAELTLTDVDRSKRALAAELGAEWIEPHAAMAARCDLLAPCALGGVLGPQEVHRLRCAVVCGAANNVLTDDEVAEHLARRGILYAPDFIVNTGGLISVYGEFRGYGRERSMELARGIERTLGRIFGIAEQTGTTPLDAARSLAWERLAEPADEPSAEHEPRLAFPTIGATATATRAE